MAPEITRITNEFLSAPVRIEIAQQATISNTIRQGLVFFKPSRKDRAFKEKRGLLREIIDAEKGNCKNGIIFCNRKVDVDILMKSMKKHGFSVGAIHGDLDQSIRTKVLDGFKEGSLRFLIASDVAARGLDIPAVSHVFNFDVPIHSEDYVHRIGRTGRAGRQGSTIMISTPAEEKSVLAIEKLTNIKIPHVDYHSEPIAEIKSSKRHPKKEPLKKNTTREEISDEGSNKTKLKTKKLPKKDLKSTKDQNNAQRVIGLGDHVPAFLTINLRN